MRDESNSNGQRCPLETPVEIARECDIHASIHMHIVSRHLVHHHLEQQRHSHPRTLTHVPSTESMLFSTRTSVTTSDARHDHITPFRTSSSIPAATRTTPITSNLPNKRIESQMCSPSHHRYAKTTRQIQQKLMHSYHIANNRILCHIIPQHTQL